MTYYHKRDSNWWETWELGNMQIYFKDSKSYKKLNGLYMTKGGFDTEDMYEATEDQLQRLITLVFRYGVKEEI